MRREVLERLFVDFLTQLQPKPEYLRLFGEVIIDVWKQKQTRAAAQHEAAQRRLNTLKERKQRLVEAFVYQRAIDESTYQEQRDRLNEAIAVAEIDERDTRIEETDVQAALGFGKFVLLSAPRFVGAVVARAKTAIAASDLPPWGAI